ncbi:MAG: DUF2442 domain-containing protein [Flavobacteriales bacterium]|nr:DUF2442 domain-containing protein [Flavobacteriales bacterium]MCZ2155076.1 DUF2442 domain-containing protein [Bryobacterales bacterium]MEB2341441.1 DUF2442 domain-containing protein [Flavobacteriia bacterium]
MDQLIHEGGLRITDVEPLAHQGLLVVVLNTGSPLMVRTAHFPRLAKATPAQLDEWEIIADGTAIGWEAIDEHLSLKGFLTAEVRNEVMDRLRSRLLQGVKHRKHKPVAAKRTRTKAKPKANAR